MKIDTIEKTAYRFLDDATNDVGNKIANNFYGKKVTYDEFKERIDEVAKAFLGMGVTNNTRVGVIMPNVPETAYIQYGLNKIGAVADYIDPRSKPIVLKDFVEREKIEMIVCAEECYNGILAPIESEIKDLLKIKDIVTPSSFTSLPTPLKQIINIKKKFQNEKIGDDSIIKKINYKAFLKQSKYVICKEQKYEKNHLAIITHSSGTTGIPKPIPLTNENMNSLVYQHTLIDLGLDRGMRFLHVLPYFAAYGAVNSEHLGSCYGMEMLEIPLFDLNKFDDLILKTKPNIVIGIPSWWEVLAKSDKLKKADLSFIRAAIAGGDSMSVEMEEKVNKFLTERGANILQKGHGMSEIAGCGTFTTMDCNKYGDLGKPLPLTEYEIFDNEKGILIPFDGTKEISGEAYIHSASMTSGKLDDRQIAKIVNINGKNYVASGDIVLKRKDGSIHFLEREDRSFTRFDGYKIHPSKIEDIIRKHPCISDCIIVNYYDEQFSGNMPIIHVVLEDENIDKMQLINEIVFETMGNNKELTTRDIPTKWKFRNSIPLNMMQKKDYKALIKEGLSDEEFDVNIVENNMRIDNIEIKEPNLKKKIK